MNYRYDIEANTNIIRIYDENDNLIAYQPHNPENPSGSIPFASEQEAADWAERFIAERIEAEQTITQTEEN